ncbi:MULTISPECIES: hypothetical protein [unclassified Streptomyces]|uniref:hypothetical protein n=1 Tax=unclassified Streptomyces TaxID=2593676 RepID=UPI0038154218
MVTGPFRPAAPVSRHVLTAIAINIGRLSEQEPRHSAHRPRQPTAFQQYLEARGLSRPLWWRQGK